MVTLISALFDHETARPIAIVTANPRTKYKLSATCFLGLNSDAPDRQTDGRTENNIQCFFAEWGIQNMDDNRTLNYRARQKVAPKEFC